MGTWLRLSWSSPLGFFVVPACELGNLDRADEPAVHRPGKEHKPLARVTAGGDVAELLAELGAHDRLELECRKLVSHRQHLGHLPRAARRAAPAKLTLRPGP